MGMGDIHRSFYTPQQLPQSKLGSSLPFHSIQHLLFLLKRIFRRDLSAHCPADWGPPSILCCARALSKVHGSFTSNTTRRNPSTQRPSIKVILLMHQRNIIYNPRALPINLIQRRRNLAFFLRHWLSDHSRSSLCSCSWMSSYNARTPTRRPHLLPSSYRPWRPSRRSSRRRTTAFSPSTPRLPSCYGAAHFSDFVHVM